MCAMYSMKAGTTVNKLEQFHGAWNKRDENELNKYKDRKHKHLLGYVFIDKEWLSKSEAKNI